MLNEQISTLVGALQDLVVNTKDSVDTLDEIVEQNYRKELKS